jgi:hypothetical protein
MTRQNLGMGVETPRSSIVPNTRHNHIPPPGWVMFRKSWLSCLREPERAEILDVSRCLCNLSHLAHT